MKAHILLLTVISGVGSLDAGHCGQQKMPPMADVVAATVNAYIPNESAFSIKITDPIILSQLQSSFSEGHPSPIGVLVGGADYAISLCRNDGSFVYVAIWHSRIDSSNRFIDAQSRKVDMLFDLAAVGEDETRHGNYTWECCGLRGPMNNRWDEFIRFWRAFEQNECKRSRHLVDSLTRAETYSELIYRQVYTGTVSRSHSNLMRRPNNVGAANGSQPIRAQTNRTSVTAGSDR